MMLKRGTLLLLLSAIALGGAVLLLENQSSSQSTESASGGTEETAASEKLFPFEEEEIEQFSITRLQSNVDAEGTVTEDAAEEKLSFRKNDDGTWQMTAPEEAMAEGGAIAFLLSQVTTPAAVPVIVEASNLEEFGLAEPESTVLLTANGREYRLRVGGLDFLGDKRYVEAIELPTDSAEQTNESRDKALTIYAISGGIVNAVNRPTADWLLVVDDGIEGNTFVEDADKEATTTEETAREEAKDSASPDEYTESGSEENSLPEGSSAD